MSRVYISNNLGRVKETVSGYKDERIIRVNLKKENYVTKQTTNKKDIRSVERQGVSSNRRTIW